MGRRRTRLDLRLANQISTRKVNRFRKAKERTRREARDAAKAARLGTADA